MASNAARNLLILGGVGVLGYWWYSSMKTASASTGTRALSGGAPTGGAPTGGGAASVPVGGKSSLGTPTGETSTQQGRDTSSFVEPSDLRYTSEPAYEDTSAYFGTSSREPVDADYGTRGPSSDSYGGDEYDFGTRG